MEFLFLTSDGERSLTDASGNPLAETINFTIVNPSSETQTTYSYQKTPPLETPEQAASAEAALIKSAQELDGNR